MSRAAPRGARLCPPVPLWFRLRHLTLHLSFLLLLSAPDIKWNFGKFLVDKEGVLVERYAPTTSPSSIEPDILKLLDA